MEAINIVSSREFMAGPRRPVEHPQVHPFSAEKRDLYSRIIAELERESPRCRIELLKIFGITGRKKLDVCTGLTHFDPRFYEDNGEVGLL